MKNANTDTPTCKTCFGKGYIPTSCPDYVLGSNIMCAVYHTASCPSCSNTKDLESEVIKEIMKPSTGGEKVSVTMVMCTMCFQEAPCREMICHDKYCSRAPTPPSTEEVLKIIPSEELDSDPKWQVALRDQGYRCEKTCELAGCHRCNPVPTESTCAVTGDEALFSHGCPNPRDHVPPPEVAGKGETVNVEQCAVCYQLLKANGVLMSIPCEHQVNSKHMLSGNPFAGSGVPTVNANTNTNPVPTESRCERCGRKICQYDGGCSEVFKYCNKIVPECHGCPTPQPEVGEWEERFDKTFGTRWINAEHGPGEIKSFIRSVLSSQSSAFQKKIGEAKLEGAIEVAQAVEDTQSRESSCATCNKLADAARAAADRIKKENL